MALFFEIDKKNCQVELACLKMMKVNDRYIFFLTFFVIKRGVPLFIKIDKIEHISQGIKI